MKQRETFSPSFFEILKKAEENHFWFRIRRKWIFDTIRKYVPPPAALLEAGCGTGNVSSYLAGKGYSVTGCEFYEEALEMAWPGFEKITGDVSSLPFEDNTFDVVCLFDVIEHLDDDVLPLKEAKRVLKKNGIIVLSVPAREELWSHVDEEAFHKRRYTKKTMSRLLSQADLVPVSMNYMFMTLYFPMKYLRGRQKGGPEGYLSINPVANSFLGFLFDAERCISKVFALPAGTSLIAAARRRL